MNANLTLLSTSNTFQDQMILINNLAAAVNQLRNGLFYADGGSVTLANGVLLITTSTGTVISVSGNATFSQQITSGAIQNQGTFTSQGNTALFPSNTVLVNVANTVLTKNLIATTNIFTGNLSVSLNANVNGVMNVNTSITTKLANANTGNIIVLDVQTLNVGNSLFANNIIFDNTAAYSQHQGNLVINNLTVQGHQIVQGTTVSSSNSFQLRSGVATDGSGAYNTWRGTTIAANASLLFNNLANVWQASANDSLSYNTILTTGNLVNSFASVLGSSDSANAVTVAAVNATYAAALTNATAIVANNGVFVAQRKGFNLIPGVNINLNVTANGANTTLTDIIIGSTTSLTDSITSLSTNTAATANSVNWAFVVAEATAQTAYSQANAAYAAANSAGAGAAASLPLAGGTMSGTIEMANNRVDHAVLKAPKFLYSNVGSIGTAAYNIDVGASGNWIDLTLIGSPTINLVNVGPTGSVCSVTLIMRQDSTGNHNYAIGNNVHWSDSLTPVLSTNPNVGDILQLFTYNGGLIWWGAQVMANVPGANQY